MSCVFQNIDPPPPSPPGECVPPSPPKPGVIYDLFPQTILLILPPKYTSLAILLECAVCMYYKYESLLINIFYLKLNFV
jgi:hypothetical protein